MKDLAARSDLIQSLQKDILRMQGGGSHDLMQPALKTGLGPLEQAFPDRRFPTGAVHEFLSGRSEDAAATSGFMGGLLSCLMQQTGLCIWISTGRRIFPPALQAFGIAPERIVFIDLPRNAEALWTIEEALSCSAIRVVVGEISQLDFTASRRLQLAVEQSRVTGLIHRFRPKGEGTNACSSRWKITALPSTTEEGLPGMGFPRWQVQLQKVRNGRPGSWIIEWTGSGFRHVPLFTASAAGRLNQKTG